jgi:cardiolipin synthase
MDKFASSHQSTSLPLCLFALLFYLLTLAGCASLPRFEETYQRVDTEKENPPEIVGPHGQLSPEITKKIMKRLKKHAGPTDLLDRHIALMESIGGSPLAAGNKATLLIDGPATYAAMFKAIEHAKDHVNLETYIFEDDEVGRRFADLLLEKQSEGVQVNLIYDSLGCLNTPAAFFQRLQDGGIKTLEFNPIHPAKARKGWPLTHRDHRKILIVDGVVAFTGGVNISRVYSSSSLSAGKHENKVEEAWRDTHVQIEGPAVAEFQKLFLDTWARQRGPDLPKRDYFPGLRREGSDLIDGVWSTVGSTNMDLWSFLRNDEVNAVILGRDFAAEMEAMFEKDIEESHQIHLGQWKKRAFSERAKEWSARLLQYWL